MEPTPQRHLFVVTHARGFEPGDPDAAVKLDKPKLFGKGHGTDQPGVPFRLYDDDDILYYEGFLFDRGHADAMASFAPLDWAMADSGCTRLDLFERGEWGRL
jgi:hypothetical protein